MALSGMEQWSGQRATQAGLVRALNELARSKRPSAVLCTLHEMQSSGLQINEFHISAALKAGDWQFALHILDVMLLWRIAPNVVCLSAARFWNLHPDVVTFNTAISACAKGSSWIAALGFFCALELLGFEGNAQHTGSCWSWQSIDGWVPCHGYHLIRCYRIASLVVLLPSFDAWRSAWDSGSRGALFEQQLEADHITLNSVSWQKLTASWFHGASWIVR
eukprot:Skav227632  [mRNA]  locus=scaffold3692:56663:58400:+ [translate_table: standard]